MSLPDLFYSEPSIHSESAQRVDNKPPHCVPFITFELVYHLRLIYLCAVKWLLNPNSTCLTPVWQTILVTQWHLLLYGFPPPFKNVPVSLFLLVMLVIWCMTPGL